MEDKKIICFDVNGTLIDADSWGMFEESKQELKDIFNRYEKGDISINGLWEGMVSAFRKTGKASKEFICGFWAANNYFKEGAEDLISYLKSKKYKIYLISCSVGECLEPLSRKLSLDGFYAGSHLVFDDKGELVKIESECDGRPFKKEKLEELARKEGVDVRDIVFVGDGENDIGVFKMTGRGIAVDGDNEELVKNSWKQVDSLSEIKGIL